MTHVLITTKNRGIYFGEINWDTRHNEVIDVRNMRHVYYYTAPAGSDKGTFSLVTIGPQSGSRVGPVVEMACLHDIATVCVCTTDAVKAFSESTWS